jgi:hypothetical protein
MVKSIKERITKLSSKVYNDTNRDGEDLFINNGYIAIYKALLINYSGISKDMENTFKGDQLEVDTLGTRDLSLFFTARESPNRICIDKELLTFKLERSRQRRVAYVGFKTYDNQLKITTFNDNKVYTDKIKNLNYHAFEIDRVLKYSFIKMILGLMPPNIQKITLDFGVDSNMYYEPVMILFDDVKAMLMPTVCPHY